MENMWSISLDDDAIGNLMLPDEIVERQCEYLKELTNGAIIAKTSPFGKSTDDDSFFFEFYLTSTLTPSYKFTIMYFSYKIGFYPMKIYVDDEIRSEVGAEGYSVTIGYAVDVASESDFMTMLAKIINSKKVKNVISSLYSMKKSHERRNMSSF